jgi:RNA polymerase sigma factor (sigma-70 family)
MATATPYEDAGPMDQTVLRRKVSEVRADGPRAAAFRSLADHHLDGSYRLARAILREPAEAEDATHDAFVTAWQKWPTLREPALFERWFRKILVNTCRTRLRRASRWHLRDISDELTLTAVDDVAVRDDRDAIGRALMRLGPDDRIVLALRYDRDLTVDAIADALGIPSGTVKSRLHNALRRLHVALDAADAAEVSR